MPPRELLLGRQPILDRDQNLAAFELLFRSGHTNDAQVDDDLVASATVINHAFSELGIEAVLGPYLGFINLPGALIHSDVIELLPRDRVVLEVLETVDVNDALVERLKALKAAGFRIALDDYVGHEDAYDAVLDVVDVVKVDVDALSLKRLAAVMARLQKRPLILLAEKVNTAAEAKACLDLGFDLFQGYYFAKPLILRGTRHPAAESAIVQLMSLLAGTRDVATLEPLFASSAELTRGLRRLVDAFLGSAHGEIRSVSHAQVLVGRRPLRRLLELLIYAVASSPDARFPSPLLVLAATRARLMETLARDWPDVTAGMREQAFLAGNLSLAGALLASPMNEMLASLPLAEPVRAALLDRGGALGDMLRLVERIEQADPDGVAGLLAGLPFLDAERVNDAYVQAIEWANRFGTAATMANIIGSAPGHIAP